jgi:hypothetical protein
VRRLIASGELPQSVKALPFRRKAYLKRLKNKPPSGNAKFTRLGGNLFQEEDCIDRES